MAGDTEINQRKKDHINLALQSQVIEADSRFYYEPILAGHPKPDTKFPISLANGTVDPVWTIAVSEVLENRVGSSV